MLGSADRGGRVKQSARVNDDDRVMVTQCEMVFTPEKARRVQLLIEAATQRPCPCKMNRACPLIRRADDERPEPQER